MNQTDFVINDKENLICVTKPDNIIYPPYILSISGHTVMTHQDINLYFNLINMDKIKITYINGVKTDFNFDSVYCHYCKSYCDGDIYHYCYHCWANMCDSCYMEMISGQSTSKSRLCPFRQVGALLACKEHPQELVSRTKNDTIIFACNVCHQIILDKLRYSKNLNNGETIDLCLDCRITVQGKKFYEKNQLELVPSEINIDICGFGSMFDWVPIIRDDDFNLVLYNQNLDSTLFDRLALSAEDANGRRGYFVVPRNLNLEVLLNRLERYYNDDILNNSGRDRDEQDIFYNRPIKQLMRSLGMPIHYG